MTRGIRLGLGGVALVVAASVAAVGPRALAPAAGGLWDVSREANGHDPVRLCLPDPALLAQFEHRGGTCTRVVVADRGTTATIRYTCADGSFGNSDLTLITPRAIRVDTQGISRGYPFHYQLHARRVGACPVR